MPRLHLTLSELNVTLRRSGLTFYLADVGVPLVHLELISSKGHMIKAQQLSSLDSFFIKLKYASPSLLLMGSNLSLTLVPH